VTRDAVRRFAWTLIGVTIMALVLTTVATVSRTRDLTAEVQAQSDRNTAVVECLTDYAARLTDALQDRDVVNKTGRAASGELWSTIRRWTQHPGTGSTDKLVEAINRYEEILDRISRTAAINPYPDVTACLTSADPGGVRFNLVAYQRKAGWDDYCLGRPVTIRGTYGPDIIHGTDGPDVIFAYSGDDLIQGGKGNDRICGRWGDDTVNAGKGYDRVDCGAGDDLALQAEPVIGCE